METYTLLSGDPMDPQTSDVIAICKTLAVGEPVPDGFRVISGNTHISEIWGIATRFDIEERKY
jgi:hypothetical protein